MTTEQEPLTREDHLRLQSLLMAMEYMGGPDMGMDVPHQAAKLLQVAGIFESHLLRHEPGKLIPIDPKTMRPIQPEDETPA